MNLFWEKASSEPRLRWEKWRTQVKLAILAEKSINLDVLLNQKPATVFFQPKHVTSNQSTIQLRLMDEKEHPKTEAQFLVEIEVPKTNACRNILLAVIAHGTYLTKNAFFALSEQRQRVWAHFQPQRATRRNKRTFDNRTLEHHGSSIHEARRLHLVGIY